MNDILCVIPAIAMGACLPATLMVLMIFSKKRSLISFNSFFHGMGTFLFSLVAVFILVLLFGKAVVPTLSISGEADADVYIYVGAAIILLLFYLVSEALKIFSFKTALKSEKKLYAGTAFGCGFILAQNLLIFGLVFVGELDLGQSFAFGFLMLLTGVIYLSVATVSYRIAKEKQYLAGSAIAILYYLLFMAMILFSNVYVTYISFAIVFAFVMVVAYIVLPLPFKKKDGNAV